MASPIEIPIASETKAFQMGVENGIIKPLDDAEDALKNLAKGGDKASDKLDDFGRAGKSAGNDIEDALNDAQRASDKTRRELDDLADSMEKAGRKGSTIDEGVRKGTEGAAEATAEFKDEAIQNLGETVSSFRGDAEDIAQIAQDTLGGVIGNLGPVGMAAGIAGAVGIGLIIAEIEKAKEAEQEFRENVAELADSLIETGGEGADAIAAIADRMRGMATETDENAMDLDKLREMAKDLEVPFADLAQAYASGNGDLKTYIENLDDRIAKEQKAFRESTKYTEGATLGTTALGVELEKQRDQLKGVSDQYKAAGDDAKNWEESGAAAIAARADAMETLQSELDDAIGAWSEYADAETGAADPEKYMAAMQARIDATTNFNDNVRTLAETTGLTTEEMQAVLDQGVDFGPTLAAIVAGGDESMAKYAGIVQQIIGGGQEIIDGTPLTSTVTAEGDTEAANAELDKTAEDRGTTVEAAAETKAAGQDLDAVADKRRTAKISARAETGTASSTLSNLARDRSMTITVNIDKAEAERQLTEFQNRYRETTVNVKTRGGKEVP